MIGKILRQKLKRILAAAPAILTVALLYLIMGISGIGCPIRFLTGISCPGCGMTRALLSLLRLDFASAFRCHPLFVLLLPAFLIYLFQELIPPKIYKILIFTFVALFVTIYLVRLSDPADEIVYCHVERGLIFRILKHFCEN